MGSVIMASTPPKMMVFGVISFNNTLGQVTTTFATPMQSAAYTVYYYLITGGSLSFAATSNQTATGFTTTLSVSVNAQLGWLAVMN